MRFERSNSQEKKTKISGTYLERVKFWNESRVPPLKNYEEEEDIYSCVMYFFCCVRACVKMSRHVDDDFLGPHPTLQKKVGCLLKGFLSLSMNKVVIIILKHKRKNAPPNKRIGNTRATHTKTRRPLSLRYSSTHSCSLRLASTLGARILKLSLCRTEKMALHCACRVDLSKSCDIQNSKRSG
jgi:hypothetical protein